MGVLLFIQQLGFHHKSPLLEGVSISGTGLPHPLLPAVVQNNDRMLLLQDRDTQERHGRGESDICNMWGKFIQPSIYHFNIQLTEIQV